MSKNIGKVSQVIGPVVDVMFENNETELPNIYDSLEITRNNGDKLILECQQHIGEDTVKVSFLWKQLMELVEELR